MLIKDENFLEKFLSRLESIADKYNVEHIKILSQDKIFQKINISEFSKAGKHLNKLKINAFGYDQITFLVMIGEHGVCPKPLKDNGSSTPRNRKLT
jgi:hypothetical protein